MKKLWLFLILIIPLKVQAISANSYIVMDQDSGRVLEGVDIHEESLIASITKIMTCIVAIEHGDFDKIVKVNDSILKAYGSGIYIQVGEEITLDDLLYGLMLRSGNDAALAIADAVTGNLESFVYLMNEKASEIGMDDSHFVNPSGLEENDNSANKSTVYDMALLTRYAMSNEHYRRIVSTKEMIVKSSYKTYKWTNKNKLLLSYEYCTGGKTGFTKKARRTLVTTATKDDISLIVVTFNDGNDFKDHRDLYEKYFNSYNRTKILSTNEYQDKNLYLKDDFYIVSKDDERIEKELIVDDLEKKQDGELGGKVNIYLNGELLDYRYLYYRKPSVADDKSFISKLMDALIFWR